MAKFWLILFVVLLTAYTCKAEILPTATQSRSWTTSTAEKSMITEGSSLRPRDVNSVCGSWSTWIGETWQTSTISCAKGIPCVFEKVYSGLARGYCSSAGARVITSAFDYGQGPAGGCTAGQLCCGSVSSAYGVYVFDSGASTLTTCGATRFWQSATGAVLAVTTSSSSPSPSPTSSDANNNKLSTAQIVGIAVGGVSALGSLVGAIIAIHKYHSKRKRQKAANDAVGLPLHNLPAGSTFHVHVQGDVYLMGPKNNISRAAIAGRSKYQIGGRSGYISYGRVQEIED